jgi:bacteriocin-like protein
VIRITVSLIAARHSPLTSTAHMSPQHGSGTMDNQSNGSIQLTDKELAGVSGGEKKERVIKMEEVTIVVFTHGSTINGSPKK